MLLPETGAAYSAPLSSSWLSELFSSVYSSGSCGRLYRSVGEKENPQPLADRSRSRPTASHAEMEAIAQANERLGTWRLDDCELYVTLEPCPMCAGAILNARIRRVWYGARDEAFGACGGVTNLFMESFPNRPALVGGILGEDCRRVLADFFAGLRGGEKNRPSDLI